MLTFKAPPYPAKRPERLAFFLYLCVGFADGMVIPFFPLWAHSQAGIPIGLIGLLFGCYAGGELVAAPLIGGIADKVGRRVVLITSSIGVGCGFVILYFTHGVFEAAFALLGIGIFESVLHPTISTVIADVTAEDTHRRQFSLARVSSGIGRVVGPALGAVLAWLSLGSVFLAAGAGLLLGALLMILRLPETRTAGEPQEDDEEEGLSALLPAFSDGRLAGLLLWFMLLEIAGSWIEAVLPLHANASGILTPSGVGLLFAYASAITVIAQIPVTSMLSKRSGIFIILTAGCVLISAFTILVASTTLLALIVAVTLYAFSQMLTGPLIPTAVNKLALPQKRAGYMAATSVANDLRDSIGPATGTAIYALSSRLPWMIGIPLAAVAATGLGVMMREPEGPPKPPRKRKLRMVATRPEDGADRIRICGLR